MYVYLLDFHNLFRWLIILAALWALFRMWSGWQSKAAWSKQDRIAGLVFSTVLNLQVLLGLGLIFTSQIMQAAMKNMSVTMKDGTLRFFLIEHPTAMLLAAILAQVGFSVSKRAPDDQTKFKKAAIFYTIAFVLILLAIPWPFLKYGRTLFPFTS